MQAGLTSPGSAGLARRLMGEHVEHADAPAVVTSGGEIAWVGLQARIDAAARAIASRVEPGARVAVCTADSRQELVAAAAVVCAGGVFVPLDPDDPRAAARLAHSGARVLVTDGGCDIAGSATVLMIGQDGWIAAGDTRTDWRDREAADDAPACVLYRWSGDREPREITLPVRALLPPVFGDALDFTPRDRVALAVSFAHETTCTAPLRALAAGAGVIDLGARTPLTPRATAARLRDHGATVLAAPAPLVDRLARQFPWALAPLRLILCVGGLDGFTALPSLPAAVRERCWWLYGSAEAGGYAAMCRCDANGHVVARTPLGTRLLLGDAERRRVEDGEGQVCIDTPWGPCLTGDRARRSADGALHPAGRADRRLVVQDLRIEPEEIEAVLACSPRIASARVERVADGLAATVAAASGQRIDGDEVEAILRASLPPRLVPRSIVVDAGEPATDLEQALVTIWTEVLQRPHIGLHDNFFDVGGHSMKLVRVASLVQQRLGARVTMVTLFAHPTIHKLAKHLAGAAAAGVRLTLNVQ